AHMFSPAGPCAAGEFGAGLLSMGSFQPGGLVSLPEAWRWAEEAAADHGTTVTRDQWRIVIPFHLADSKEQAIEEVREGARAYNHEYFAETLGRTREAGAETIEATIARGGAIVGTPDDAIATIEN